MSVAAIMTKKVQVTTENASLASLRQLFTDTRFQHVPVIDQMHCLIGIVSVKDYFKALAPILDSATEKTAELFMQGRKVRHIMTSPVISISQDTQISRAAALLLKHNISCLPVIDSQQRLIGIVSWKDIMRLIVLKQQRRSGGQEEE